MRRPPDGMSDDLLQLSVGDASIVIDPGAGGRAVSWSIAGLEILHRFGSHAVEYGMYAMAPWAGRLRSNAVPTASGPHTLPVTYAPWALHGTVLDQSARVVSTLQEETRAEVVLVTDEHPSWPWPMSVVTAWTLLPDSLTSTIEVQAEEKPFPVTMGWHPWFRREVGGRQLAWWMDADGMLLRDRDGLPESFTAGVVPGPYDDAFRVPDGQAHLEWPGVLRLDVDSDGGWYVVFDVRPECVCLEPQTGPPDALEDRPWHAAQHAAPGEPLRLTVTWRWSDLRADPA